MQFVASVDRANVTVEGAPSAGRSSRHPEPAVPPRNRLEFLLLQRVAARAGPARVSDRRGRDASRAPPLAMATQCAGPPPREGGKDRPVRPVHARSCFGATQDGDLMAQYEELNVL
jgi:hypothetical protein